MINPAWYTGIIRAHKKSPGSRFPPHTPRLPSASLLVSLSFSQPGAEKEHKTFLFHRATAFKSRLHVCMVLMTHSLQMFGSFRVFRRVCDHLRYGRYVMLPSPAASAHGKLKMHQSSDQARANNGSGSPQDLALLFFYHISPRTHVNQAVWRLFLGYSVHRV